MSNPILLAYFVPWVCLFTLLSADEQVIITLVKKALHPKFESRGNKYSYEPRIFSHTSRIVNTNTSYVGGEGVVV